METITNRVFTFGKHKGKPITEVIRKTPHYIEWAIENVKSFKLTNEENDYFERTKRNYIEAWNNAEYAFKRGKGASKEMYITVEAYHRGEIRPYKPNLRGGMESMQHCFSESLLDPDFNEIDDIVFGSNPMAILY